MAHIAAPQVAEALGHQVQRGQEEEPLPERYEAGLGVGPHVRRGRNGVDGASPSGSSA